MRKIAVFGVVFLCLLALAFPSTVFAQGIDELILLTEQYPPFNFKKDGKLQGVSIELLEAILQKAGSKLGVSDISLVPWARGYKDIQNKPNTMLFAMNRSEARENLFKWVGPIAPAKIVLFAKKGKGVTISSPADLKKYKIGTVREDIGEQLIVEIGVTMSSLDSSNKAVSCFKKLDMGRIDATAYEEAVGKHLLKENALDVNDFEVVYALKGGPAYYYAMNQSVSDSVVKQLQDAYDALVRDGTYQKILDKYLK